MSVARHQHHTRANPCRVCHGTDPAGRDGVRCWGFDSADGDYVRCSRADHAGGLDQGPDQMYPHKLTGGCKCGERHDGSSAPLPPVASSRSTRSSSSSSTTSSSSSPAPVPPPAPESIAAIVKACVPDPGRLADYLVSRGLPRTVPTSLKFHPGLRYQQDGDPVTGTFPVMVAPFQAVDGPMTGLHRTFLAVDGLGKAAVATPKKMLGPVAGSAIRLARAGRLLAICEGIETGCAVLAATGLPVWVGGSASGVKGMLLPPFVEEVWLFADHDASGVGRTAAEALAASLVATGRRVYILVPPTVGEDWLDVFVRAGPEAIRTARATAEPWRPAGHEGLILIGPAVDRYMTTLLTPGGRPPAVRTPYRGLNFHLNGGWRRGQFIVVGGEAGMGKSALVLECARQAVLDGHGVLFVSVEMDVGELTGRYLAQAAQVDHAKLERGDLTADDRHRLVQASLDADGRPLVFDPETTSLEALAARLDTWTGPPLGLVVVDYLQLLQAPTGIKERTLQLDALSRGFKLLAKRVNLPMIVLSGFNREPKEARGKREPTNARLRGTSMLDHDADVVLLLHGPREAAPMREVECLITKNRGGRGVGRVRLQFEGSTFRFFDTAWRPTGAPAPHEED